MEAEVDSIYNCTGSFSHLKRVC